MKSRHPLYRRYGSWAIVTGASSGIGYELSLRLAAAGLNLVLSARRRSVLERMARELTAQYGIEVRVIALDLSLASSIETLISQTEDLPVALLVMAAGFGTSGAFLQGKLAQEQEMLALNCGAPLTLSWHFGQRFVRQRQGGIVLVSSIVAFQGVPFTAHYAATKAYIQALGEALAVELTPWGVDVLVSAPGPTHSEFADRAGLKLGKALSAGEVAQATLNALGNRGTVFPGFLSKLLMYSLAPLPRWLRVRIMGGVMKGMTQPENFIESNHG